MYKEEKLTGCDRCSQKALFVDVYRQPFRLLLPDGHDTYRTFIGALLSLFTIVIILTTGVYKFTTLINKDEYRVQLRTIENEFTLSQTFGSSDGFAIAAAVTSYDGSSEDITDPEIGEIKFYQKQWDVDAPQKGVFFTELKTKICEQGDFNDIDGTNSETSPFYPLNPQSFTDLRTYGVGKMRCLADLKELEMFGDYDTNKASNLMVVFEKCDLAKRAQREKCKNEKEIADWMVYKYIVILENEAKFILHKFGEERID